MQVFQFSGRPADPIHTVLTLGNFDGVHLGHQALIRRVIAEARAQEAQSALLTFDPHPQAVLGNREVPVLTVLAQRLRLFEHLGLDLVGVIPFTLELARKSPEAFVAEYLLANFSIKRLIIGYDFAFGQNRSGTAKILEQLSREHGFAFEVFPAVTQEGEVVGSTRIRGAVQRGEFDLAERLLGRPYSVLGTVVGGRRKGRELGFPTLNLVPGFPLPLGFGVYACRVVVGERVFDAVGNYGIKPTVGAEEPVLEAHLFDFAEDIYGHTVEIIPLKRLREEKKFASLEELKLQIARDSQAAREFLAKEGG